MENKLVKIETLTLRDFIDQEMTKLQEEALEILSMPTELAINNMTDALSKTAKLVILQEIAYRLEYRFITEIGKTSLKHHLVKA